MVTFALITMAIAGTILAYIGFNSKRWIPISLSFLWIYLIVALVLLYNTKMENIELKKQPVAVKTKATV